MELVGIIINALYILISLLVIYLTVTFIMIKLKKGEEKRVEQMIQRHKQRPPTATHNIPTPPRPKVIRHPSQRYTIMNTTHAQHRKENTPKY